MCVPLDALQYDSRPPGLLSGPLAVTRSLLLRLHLSQLRPLRPPPALLERLTPEQRASFLRVWKRLPSHLRAVAIKQLGDVLCDFADVFSKSKTCFVSCSLMTFDSSVPEGSPAVTSRPHQINPILAKEVDATLNQYLATGLIQHSPHRIRARWWSSRRSREAFESPPTTRNSTRLAASASCPFLPWTMPWILWARDGCFPCSTWFLRSIRLPITRIPSLSWRLYSHRSL